MAQYLVPNKLSVIVTIAVAMDVVIITTNPQMLMFIPDGVLSDPNEDNIYIL